MRSDFLEVLGLFVLSAGLLVMVGRWIRLPSIVSYLAAGLLIGPVTGLVMPADESAAIELVGEMGIVLLMFVVGLELSLERIRQVGKVAVAAGLGQVVFTAAGGFVLAMLLGFEVMESIFIATALTFSSTVVVVKLLDQKGDLSALYGQIAVGIFLVQDLVVIVVLTFLAGLQDPAAAEPGALAASLASAFGGMAALLAVSFISARYLLPAALRFVAAAPRTSFMASLTWCFAFVLAAHGLGLSAEIGAFLAGLSLAQLRLAADLKRRMHPLMSFFIAVFFVSLGARMELAEVQAYGPQALALSVFVLIGNPLIFMWIITRYGYSARTSFLTSVTVAQISEFSFIFAALGVGVGLIEPPILAVVAVVGIVTIALSAYMILYNEWLYEQLSRTGIFRLFRARAERDEERPSERLHGHVVVVGMNDLGRRLVLLLQEKRETVVAVDTDYRKLAGLPCRTVVGDVDYMATLEETDLDQARLAISALRIEPANKLFVFRCKAAGVPVTVYAPDRPTFEQLRDVDADHLVESKEESGRRLMQELGRLLSVAP